MVRLVIGPGDVCSLPSSLFLFFFFFFFFSDDVCGLQSGTQRHGSPNIWIIPCSYSYAFLSLITVEGNIYIYIYIYISFSFFIFYYSQSKSLSSPSLSFLLSRDMDEAVNGSDQCHDKIPAVYYVGYLKPSLKSCESFM